MVKQFAASHGLEFTKKRTSYNDIYRKQANSIGAKMPFLYNESNRKTISAYNVTEEKLEWLVK